MYSYIYSQFCAFVIYELSDSYQLNQQGHKQFSFYSSYNKFD